MRLGTVVKQNPVSLASKLLRRTSLALQTGYWHTGERCSPDFPDENFVNHFKVYRFASQFSQGKRILDVGCGTGYGASYLAESARSVTGIDLSRQAIRFARRRYGRVGMEFLRMNAERLAFAPCSFDFIISTENFEHLSDQRANLHEMGRVLTDDGMLLLATPNHEMFLDVDNPFHTHELTYDEFLDLVDASFHEYLICENSLTPPTEGGRRMLEERRRRGHCGVDLSSQPYLWGVPVDTTCLSNTHSFFCFARAPRRGVQTEI